MLQSRLVEGIIELPDSAPRFFLSQPNPSRMSAAEWLGGGVFLGAACALRARRAARALREDHDLVRSHASPVLILPGINGSEPAHWQSIWERDEGWSRAAQSEWSTPRLDDWVAGLRAAIAAARSPPVLVCHSLGCVLAVHYLAARVAAVLLVAPPDIDAFEKLPTGEPNTFRPAPRAPLGVPAAVVASCDDPYCAPDVAAELAAAWGATFFSVGQRGHISTASGCGPWPEGKRFLAALLRRVPS